MYRSLKLLNRLSLTFGFVAVLFSGYVSGATETGFEYEEGTHYALLAVPVKTRDPSKVEVTEYFSYGCPHCYQFEPMINPWKASLPDYVTFNRTPAIWNAQYEYLAQVYYAVEALDAIETVHTPIFQGIHGNLLAGSEKNSLLDPKGMAIFLSRYGIDPMEFAKAFNSFGVRAARQQAEARGRAYRSGGVPAIIINGKYRIEGSMTGGSAGMLLVANYLIRKEKALLPDIDTAPEASRSEMHSESD